MPASATCRLATLCLVAWGTASLLAAQTAPNMLNTKHNLSASGPGPVRSATETRICIFCHTPHNATPQSPLWNRELEGQVYSLYASPTLKAGPLPQPSGPTKLCLSCHDGTIAMGAVVNPPGGIDMGGAGTLPPGSGSDFGLDLSGHHPVSFPYTSALPNDELAPSAPPELDYGGTEEVHCITCHNPHDDQYGRFLLKDNRGSALCTTCHQLTGWTTSAHATSSASVAAILPRPPKTWPTWPELKDWACEACHTPHQAPSPVYLLSFTASPPAPYSCTTAGCHSSSPAPPHLTPGPGASALGVRPGGAGRGSDIARQVRKASAHHDQPGLIALAPRTQGGTRSVACADCHNPHRVNDRRATAPDTSGLLEGVRGVDRNGAEVDSARYEYEICLKCHGDYAPDLDTIPRVVGTTNTRLAFDTGNPSYHPVFGMGRELNVPSIPSSLQPRLTPTTVIYCSSCHADDEGSGRGPHGSAYAPILKERYETTDFSVESYESYALCYRCHERTSILRDTSFRRKGAGATRSGGGHSGHLAAGATCSACHDPHGVDDSAVTGTGSHTHLVNFDTSIVLPAGGSLYPVFKDTGTFSGSCTLSCHGVVHEGASYP